MIKSVPTTERPRERCLRSGPESLSLRECVAILLGTGPKGKGCLGVATAFLARHGNFVEGTDSEARAFFHTMESASQPSLQEVHGLGDAGRARLLAAFEIAKRYAAFRESSSENRMDSIELEDCLKKVASRVPADLKRASHEWLGFVPLFKAGAIGELCLIEKGTRTHVNVEIQEIFTKLLPLRPNAFVLLHNHPSGDPTPSSSDRALTEEVGEVADRLHIPLIQHLVITPQSTTCIIPFDSNRC